MGLETNPLFIDDLNSAWPLGTESQRQGDDHLRNIKQAVQGSFPNLGNEAVTATAAELNATVTSWESAFPVGTIYLTMGTHNPSTFLPGTWGIISEGRFLVGVGADPDGDAPAYSLGSTGGETEHTLTEAEMPAHVHQPGEGGAGFHIYKPGSGGSGHQTGTTTTTAGSTDSRGSGQSHENRPAYLACAIWQRLS